MSATTPHATASRWNQRAFVAMAAALSAIALPVTGIADSIARKSDPSSPAWAVGHALLGAAFVIFCTWHTVLNRKALLRYVRGLRGHTPSRELATALVLVGSLVALTLAHGAAG